MASFLGGLSEFVAHGERGLARDAALAAQGAMADGCECVFDDVRCAIDKSDKFLFALGRGPDDNQGSRSLRRTRSSDPASLRPAVEAGSPPASLPRIGSS